MTAINQKEYLKKYLSGKKDGKKKKRKKPAIGDRVKIIDDDIDISNLTSFQEATDLFNTNEDAPQVVGVIDDRPMHLRIKDYQNELWKPLGAQDDHNTEQSHSSSQGTGLEVNSRQKVNLTISKGRDASPIRKKSKRDGASISHRYPDDSPPRKVSKSGCTLDEDSPPRREHEKNYISSFGKKRGGSDESPVRKREADATTPPHTSDSPPRRSKRYPDASPPRKRNNDSNPPRKTRWGSVNSPPRRNESNSDSSPPHRRDISPPRRRRSNSDSSPPRRTQNNSDSSPPRRRDNRKDEDNSPPRRSRKDNDNSPPRRRNPDNSPPRRNRRDPDSSPPRRNKGISPSHVDISPPRRARRDSDNSPPRKYIKKEIESPPRPAQRRLLPGDKKGKYLIPAKRTDAQKMSKTLDGKAAGLQNKNELVKENEAFVRRENEAFKNMPSDISGANAAPIMRDRKTGKIRDLQKEAEERKEKEKREEENKEKYTRWGRGLKQVEAYEDKLSQDLHEMNKPLARYADDEDLERYLKEQEREGDPMLAYIRKKKKKKVVESGKPLKPQYEGEFMPNRFGIVPGYRWDGVDRSNGYEKKWFEVQNSKRAEQEEIYKWSTEDM